MPIIFHFGKIIPELWRKRHKAEHNVLNRVAHPHGCVILSGFWEAAGMVALRTERRVFLWRIYPRPVPIDSKKEVTLEECLKIIEAAFVSGTASAYRLSDFDSVLEACYADICEEIEAKMIAVVNGKQGW